jgi:mono/diheme cytochrome c family protein
MKKLPSVLFLVLLACTYSVKSQSKPWAVPEKVTGAKNPSPAGAVKSGKTIYMTYCTPCHGNSGKGDGPASAALSVKPANHTSAAIQAEAEGSLFYKISEGRAPMPGYKSSLSETQRWALVSYIKSMSTKS